MNNKKITGDQMRLRLLELRKRLRVLVGEKTMYSNWKRVVIVLNMRIRIKKSQIRRYENRVQRYLAEGRIE